MKVTLSFLGGLGRCFFFDLSWSPVQYKHQPMIAIKISTGKSKTIKALLRLRLRTEVTNFAPDNSFVKQQISFDSSE